MKRLLLLFIPLVFFFGCEKDTSEEIVEVIGYNCSTISGSCVESADGFYLNLQDCENECLCDNDEDEDGICDEFDDCPEWYNVDENCCQDCKLVLVPFSSSSQSANIYLESCFTENLDEIQDEIAEWYGYPDWNSFESLYLVIYASELCEEAILEAEASLLPYNFFELADPLIGDDEGSPFIDNCSSWPNWDYTDGAIDYGYSYECQ